MNTPGRAATAAGVTFQLTFMEVNYLELPDVVQLAAAMGVDRVKGHHLWVHFRQLDGQSMRRDPAAIRRWNDTVDAAQAVADRHRRPDGTKVILENSFKLDPDDAGEIADGAECPFLGTGGVGSIRRQVQPLLRPGRPAPDAGRFRQREPGKPLPNLAK